GANAKAPARKTHAEMLRRRVWRKPQIDRTPFALARQTVDVTGEQFRGEFGGDSSSHNKTDTGPV
ncbi:MAG TPA: hypothetical protein VKB88_11280, partial [Bryobacteraceae bacterium]|nr:hypothetical protein [Bryobacteraceae bacterium]